jgi:hypothetical protein
MRNRGYHLCSELLALDKQPSLRAGAKRQRHNSPRTGILLVCLLACLVLCLSPSPSQHTLAQGGLSIRESRVLVGAGAVRADPRSAAGTPRACVRNLRWHDGWHGKGDAEAATPAIAHQSCYCWRRAIIAAYPSGGSIRGLTTPAGDVQCRSSRAAVLQHAGLESSPSSW